MRHCRRQFQRTAEHIHKPHEWQVFKFFQSEWMLQQLPLLFIREKLLDELQWVTQEVMLIILISNLVLLLCAQGPFHSHHIIIFI